MTEIDRALSELRTAAAVCELDENEIVVRQATRIRAASAVLAHAIEARSAETTGSARKGESAVPEGDVPK